MPDGADAVKSLAAPKLSKKLGVDEKLVLLERAEEKYYERNKLVTVPIHILQKQKI